MRAEWDLWGLLHGGNGGMDAGNGGSDNTGADVRDGESVGRDAPGSDGETWDDDRWGGRKIGCHWTHLIIDEVSSSASG
jgi:hypothetical protein